MPAVHWQPSLFRTEERPSLDAPLAARPFVISATGATGALGVFVAKIT